MYVNWIFIFRLQKYNFRYWYALIWNAYICNINISKINLLISVKKKKKLIKVYTYARKQVCYDLFHY